MKLTKTDKKILELLKIEQYGLSCSLISRRLNIDYAHIFRRLKKLYIHNIVMSIGLNPKIFKINLNTKNSIEFLIVECPKCKTLHKIHNEQLTILCKNKLCLTISNKRTRFYVYNKRIIGNEFIIKYI